MIRLFQQHVPTLFLWLSVAEFVIFVAAVFAAWALRFLWVSPEGMVFPPDLLPRAVLFAAVLLVSEVAVGLYQKRLQEGLTGIALRIGVSAFIAMALLGVWYYIWPSSYLGRGVMLLALLLASVLALLLRAGFIRLVADRETLRRRVLVVGAGERAASILEHPDAGITPTFVLTGFIPMPGDREVISPGLRIVPDKSIDRIAAERLIDEIVVAADDRRRGLPVADLLECKLSGTDVIDLLTFFEREHGIVKLDLLHPSWLIFSDGFRYGPVRDIAKRSFDVAVSAVLLLLTWPVMLLSAAAIWLESGFRGPVLFRQVRVGQHGKPFQVLKFRSMRIDAEADGVARWATRNDTRITWVGSIMRRTRIDELPQIFNVLRGHMSFVGPRPERPEFVQTLRERIPFYDERHRVKPGITGWAQICYPYGASEEDAQQKLQYDLFYVKNYSLFLDLWILLQTAEVILWTRGAR
jgi:sugar transferase (PEP-CTERM system associated)